jgi:hypothetical protein
VPLRLALLGVSVILGWAVYEWIERPVRLGWRTRYAIPVLVLTMTIVCAAGLVVYTSKGLIERPINRNDAARLVSYYERMRTDGIADAYRRECDFMDWQSGRRTTPSASASGLKRRSSTSIAGWLRAWADWRTSHICRCSINFVSSDGPVLRACPVRTRSI